MAPPAAGGPDFEVTLAKVLATGPAQPQALSQPPSQPQGQTPIQLSLPTTPSTDSDPQAQLPAQAIAAFLAVFLAMVGKVLETGTATQGQDGAQVQAAASHDATAAAGSRVQLLSSALRQLEQLEARGGGEGGDPIMATFDQVLGASRVGEGIQFSTVGDRPTNPADLLGDAMRWLPTGPIGADEARDGPDSLVRMLEQLVAQLGASTNGPASAASVVGTTFASVPRGDPGGAFGNTFTNVFGDPVEHGTSGGVGGALKSLRELVAKATDLDGAVTGVAAAAASVARELMAANGAIAGVQSGVSSTSVGGVQAASTPRPAPLDRLAAMVEGAKAIVQIAEMGGGLNLGQLKGSSEVTIQLEPASTGTLQIHLERTSDGVRATIQASTEAGRQAVQECLGTIRDALKGAGVHVTSIELAAPLQPGRPAETVQPAQPTGAAPKESQAPDPAQPKGALPSTGPTPEGAGKAKDSELSPPPAQTPAIPQPTASRLVMPDPPAPAASPDAAKLVKDIADQVSLLAGQGKSDFHIQLRPESLGRLNVHLSMDDAGVTVRMHADSAQAKAVIESNLGQLKQSFQDQGIRVDRFVVQVSQGQLSQDSQHPRRSRGWVDDVRTNRSDRGGDDFAEALAAAGSGRPVDYRA